MCAVIDTNIFHRFFNPNDPEYCPLYRWIFEEKGKVVFGGTKYYSELKKAGKYLELFAELERLGKTVSVDSDLVDQRAKEIQREANQRRLNDAHIIAIVDESGCRVVASEDSSADTFIKNQALYKSSRRPSIYRSSKHRNLLCPDNLRPCCKK